jgi:hypothetical protein
MPQVCIELTPLRVGDYDLLSADAATLATVPGLSPARAAALEQLLRAALPPTEAGIRQQDFE